MSALTTDHSETSAASNEFCPPTFQYSPRIEDYNEQMRYLEILLNRRFNFLLVFIGVAGAVAVNTPNHLGRMLLLLVATVIGALIAATVSRSQYKFDILYELLKPYKQHPVTYCDEAIKHNPPTGIRALVCGKSRRGLIGYCVPWTCVAVVFVGAIASLILAAVQWWQRVRS